MKIISLIGTVVMAIYLGWTLKGEHAEGSTSHYFNCQNVQASDSNWNMRRCENDEVVCYFYNGVSCVKK